MMSGFIYAVLCCFTLLYSALLCFTLLHLLRRLYAEVIYDIGLHIRRHDVRIATVAASCVRR
jgi:hypothetical protein